MTTTTTRITTSDGVSLHVEETGAGTPVIFVHEFAGDHRSWEPQIRYFCRRYRCIAYAARGYTPSDVPQDVASYSQARAVDDIRDVMDGLGIARAHVVGLSMGGFAALHFGLTYPERALSLVVAGAGYGAEKHQAAAFRMSVEAVAKGFEEQGSAGFAKIYGTAASRIPFLVKDPRGWAEYAAMLAEHDATGSANTMRGVQGGRPSLWDMQDAMRALDVPTLIMTGDEDDHCLQPALLMKRCIATSGLVVLPKTGHTINLEEPAAFNRALEDFLSTVDQGRWGARDPRGTTTEIMKTE